MPTMTLELDIDSRAMEVYQQSPTQEKKELFDLIKTKAKLEFLKWEAERRSQAWEGKSEEEVKADPWSKMNWEDLAVDTGIEDFAKNLDHYLSPSKKENQ